MVIAIASDIHGNIERFRQFVNRVRNIDPKNVFILGDLIHWGKTKEEDLCVDLARVNEYNLVRGNHEDHHVNFGSTQEYNTISPKNIQFLQSAPERIETPEALFTHTLTSPHANLLRINNINDLSGVAPQHAINFFGHSHQPQCFLYDPETNIWSEEQAEKIRLNTKYSYAINPGSLGISPKGDYILFDPRKKIIYREQTN